MSFFIRFPDDPLGHGAIGVKAEVLLRAADAGLPIPPWFIVTSEAFEASLTRDQSDALRLAERVSAAAGALADFRVHAAVSDQVDEALARRGLDKDIVVLRTSFDAEDWKDTPRAVQPLSRLALRPSQVSSAIGEIWKSAFSERALLHRRAHGLTLLPRAPALIVQEMVCADVAGKAYSVDLVTGQQTVTVIAAVLGLSTLLSAPEPDADLYRVDRSGTLVTRDIAAKRYRDSANPDCESGVARLAAPVYERDSPALSDEQALQIDEMVRRLEHEFGGPQEVDWAFRNGRLSLIGSRPLAAFGRIADPDAPSVSWDLNLAAEHFPGVTLPLTASLLQEASPAVTAGFCKRMHAPKRRPEPSGSVFGRLFSVVRGRIYCNVAAWFRLFALLPDYPANAQYFASMAGASPELAADEQMKLRLKGPARFALLKCSAALAANWFGLRREVARFERTIDSALKNGPASLARARPDELIDAYEALRAALLPVWDVPFLNDFFAMVLWALLNHAARSWCSDTSGALVNDLATGRSAGTVDDPRAALAPAASQIASDASLVGVLLNGASRDIRRRLASRPALGRRVQQLVERYGDCCLGDLKMEAVDLETDPTPLYRALGRLAILGSGIPGDSAAAKQKAEEFVTDAIGGQPVRNAIFQWLLRQTLRCNAQRLRLAAGRRRAVRRVREILLELGRRYHASGLIERSEDILFLTIDEVAGCMGDGVAPAAPASLVSVRRAEYAQFESDALAPSHFEQRGPLPVSWPAGKTAGQAAPAERHGTPCCRGTIRGRARVVEKTGGAGFEAGDVLVVSYPDPAWLLYYPSASGLLVERAGPLSLGVVAARSLGVPTVAGIAGLTSWLSDGDVVEMNGETGVVTRDEAELSPPPPSEIDAPGAGAEARSRDRAGDDAEGDSLPLPPRTLEAKEGA